MSTWLDRFNFLVYDIIDSTNDEAKRLNFSITEEFVLYANSQYKGRGRGKRVWESLDGNLFFTVSLRPKKDISLVSQLSFVMSLAIFQALKSYLPPESIKLKWPNDVMVDGKKLAGILLESASGGAQTSPDYVIIGVGLNIKEAPNLPEATSLALHLKQVPKPRKLFDQIITEFDGLYELWLAGGFSFIRVEWLKHAMALGQKIQVNTPKSTLTGVFKDIDASGQLIFTPENATDSQILSMAEIFAL